MDKWKMVGRYADDEEIYVCGCDEEDCIYKLIELQEKHGELTWYSGVCDEDYVDGEYVGREKFVYFEAVEVCPYCGCENIYSMWDVNDKGFVAICKYCGKEILLCDECIHNEDKQNENSCACDWHKTKYGGECFRGITRD